jgi:curved DNA-binding protein CbpA
MTMTLAIDDEMPEEGQRPETRPSRPAPDFASSDPYAVLGLARGASPREIKRAYFDLVREYPPETNAATFKQIRAAYEKLRSTEAKVETDLFLFQPPSEWEPRRRRAKLALDFQAEDVWLLLRNRGDLARASFTQDYRHVQL